MDCQEIDNILSALKPNARGHIRGKGRVTDLLHSAHLRKLDSELMDVRVFVARISTGHTPKEILKMIDEFIYKKQVK